MRDKLVKGIINTMFEEGRVSVLVIPTDKTNLPDSIRNPEGVMISLSVTAVKDFYINDEGISFDASYGGIPYKTYLDFESIVQIHSDHMAIGIFGKLDKVESKEPEETPEEKSKLDSDHWIHSARVL